jgi:hypothetical protein
LANWLGDQFGESTQLALLAVKISSDAIRKEGAKYETVLTEPVAPDHITVITRDF